MWRIDVRYEYKEDPRLRGHGAAPDGVPAERVALSPRGSLAASVGADIHLLAVDGVHHASATALAVIAERTPAASAASRLARRHAIRERRRRRRAPVEAADAADAGALWRDVASLRTRIPNAAP